MQQKSICIRQGIKEIVLLFLIVAPLRLWAVTPVEYVMIHQFGGVSAIPGSGLTMGPGGKMFGTTYGGAASDGTGSIYELVPNGSGFGFNTLYRFDTSGSPGSDGQYPYAGLISSANWQTFYGTTQQGGSGGGVAFSLNFGQAEGGNNGLGYALEHTFSTGSEGGGSKGTMTAYTASDKNIGAALLILFGTLTGEGPQNGGSVFAFDPSNHLVQTFHSFTSSGTPGTLGDFSPQGQLVVTPNVGVYLPMRKDQIGKYAFSNVDLTSVMLYGITKSGGSNNWGTVYGMRADGSNFVVLHHFNFSNPSDGATPQGGMVLAGDTLYGTTSGGGSNFAGTVFKIGTNGSGFKVIANFNSATSGGSPQGDLIMSGSTLYGTTYSGGTNGGGTVFALSTNGGAFTILHSFASPVYDGTGNYTNTDGGWSVEGLLLSKNVLYGTAPHGGTNGFGVAYAITLPAPPLLGISASGGNTRVFWPSSATNYVLQQNQSLVTSNWSASGAAISDDGTNKSVTVPAAGSATFFRLYSTNGP